MRATQGRSGESGSEPSSAEEAARLEGVRLAARTVEHLLNNQLAVIAGYAEMLAGDPRLPDALRANVEEMERAAWSAAAVVRQLGRVERLVQVGDVAHFGVILDLERSAERRRHERVPVEAGGDGARVRRPDGAASDAAVLNVSAGGLLLGVEHPLPLGEAVEVAFRLPGIVHGLRARADVRRVEPGRGRSVRWQAGCQFRPLSPATREALARFLARRRLDSA